VITKYWKLLDACNEATDRYTYDISCAKLEGYRQALQDSGEGWSGLADDVYTLTKYGDHPMTCGVLHKDFQQ